jgi:proteasome lid subunit RPN8/RPN11
MNEICWALLGSYDAEERIWQVIPYRKVEGNTASVEADWEWALTREENQGDLMGFFHTHPVGVGVSPSDRDVRTMQAWCSALGKPLVCLIVEGDGSGIPEGVVFIDDESVGDPFKWICGRKEEGFTISW